MNMWKRTPKNNLKERFLKNTLWRSFGNRCWPGTTWRWWIFLKMKNSFAKIWKYEKRTPKITYIKNSFRPKIRNRKRERINWINLFFVRKWDTKCLKCVPQLREGIKDLDSRWWACFAQYFLTNECFRIGQKTKYKICVISISNVCSDEGRG